MNGFETPIPVRWDAFVDDVDLAGGTIEAVLLVVLFQSPYS